MHVQPVRLHGDRAESPAAQDRAEQGETVRETGADHDALRIGADAPGAGEVAREGGAQLGAAAWIAVAEGLVRGAGQRAAGRLEPGGAREGREVGAAGDEVVGGTGLFAAAWRGLGRRSYDAPLGDPGARALTCGEPALGDEVGVGLGDRVAGDAEVDGERAGGRETGPGGQPAAADGLAQRLRQSLADTGPGRLDMEVDPQSGPRFPHGNGPYPWATPLVGSMA